MPYTSEDGANRSYTASGPPSYSEWNNGERTPLLPSRQYYEPPKPADRSSISSEHRFWIIIGAFLCLVLGYIIQTPLDSYYRQSSREAWILEKEVHEKWVSGAKSERTQWDEDRKHREDQDRQEREEHEQKRHEIQWQGLQSSKCIRYGTREYTATLSNIPLGFNAVDECWAKTTWINGRDLQPTQCENSGFCGKVTGHWEVDFNEPNCQPSWGRIEDKGCWPYGSRKRRYDAELVHISEYDSWQEVCSTMSAWYGSVQLPPGADCTRCWRGRGCGSGYWATWYMDDQSC